MNPEQDPLSANTPAPTPVHEPVHETTHFAVPEYSPTREIFGYVKVFIASFVIIALVGIAAYFVIMKIIPDKSVARITEPTPTTAYVPANIASTTEQLPAIAPILPNDVFKSKINKKVSFEVPAGSVVNESGSASAITFTFASPDNKTYVVTYAKAADGCFDGIGSFKILPGQGVDFRIIQDKQEVDLKNKMHALRLFEMYGSYDGLVGFRGNACVMSAVPTKIEIKASGYDRTEGQNAYMLFDQMIQSFTL